VLTVVPGADDSGDDSRDAASSGTSLIDEIVRDGARRMLAAALQAEVEDYIARFSDERDEAGRRLVVRNGSHQPREVMTAAGAVEVVAPRVNDRRTDPDTGQRRRFSSAILPPWCRRTPKITEVLPLLYLHGLSSGDFVPALGQFLGSSAGLSPAVITKLTATWQTEARAFAPATWASSTSSTAGPTASTSPCGSRRPSCVCWCWSGCARTGARN
jgi:Transposase, Mutator family